MRERGVAELLAVVEAKFAELDRNCEEATLLKSNRDENAQASSAIKVRKEK